MSKIHAISAPWKKTEQHSFLSSIVDACPLYYHTLRLDSISRHVISKRCRNRPSGPPSGGGPRHFFDGGNRRDARLPEAFRGEPSVGESKGVCPLGRSAGFLPRARKGGTEPRLFRGEGWKGETRSGFPLQGDWFPQGAEGDSDTDSESHKRRCYPPPTEFSRIFSNVEGPGPILSEWKRMPRPEWMEVLLFRSFAAIPA